MYNMILKIEDGHDNKRMLEIEAAAMTEALKATGVNLEPKLKEDEYGSYLHLSYILNDDLLLVIAIIDRQCTIQSIHFFKCD
jgi:hypothetical protein